MTPEYVHLFLNHIPIIDLAFAIILLFFLPYFFSSFFAAAIALRRMGFCFSANGSSPLRIFSSQTCAFSTGPCPCRSRIAAKGVHHSKLIVCLVCAERRAASRMRTTVRLLASDERSVLATFSVPRTTAAR